MNALSIIALAMICTLVSGLEDEDSRKFHKKKRRPYYQQQGSPCGFRDAGLVENDRSLLAATAVGLGGAAVGYHLANKHKQQPIINNIITTGGGGGYPCGGGGEGRPPIFGGGFGNPITGASSFVGSHVGSHFGGLGGLGGFGGPFGGPFNGINWNKSVRQFNREIVRPITRWF